MKIAEDSEDWLEEWFTKRQKAQPDLGKALCIEELKMCCAAGHFGPECSACPGVQTQENGEMSKPCNGFGDCDGDGTRTGTGKCDCNWGYNGDLCNECSADFFPVMQNETLVECKECYEGCKDGCTSEGPKSCKACKEGYLWDENEGCKDIDECKLSAQATDESSKKCTKDHELCVNTEGSFNCECEKDYVREDDKDDGACIFDPEKCFEGCADGCTSEGPKGCKSCKEGYKMDENLGCQDIDECKISAEAPEGDASKKCTNGHEICVNTGGSFNCECEKGYAREGEDDACRRLKVVYSTPKILLTNYFTEDTQTNEDNKSTNDAGSPNNSETESKESPVAENGKQSVLPGLTKASEHENENEQCSQSNNETAEEGTCSRPNDEP
ncbi:calcium-binding EGF domain-containing protein [Ditylenchus destructor]|uniref:protein disulfide-isomerase n=1 Tax=Ditylenchus destructor TaxID=166010 RepID=A0AAD4MHL8_9BILA|nr:calcium-binding EGF domain-containing protein [Ditylenchus destructor]